jgi:hypothetical protein
MDMLLEVASCYSEQLVRACLDTRLWRCNRTYCIVASPRVFWGTLAVILLHEDGSFKIGILGLSFDRALYDWVLFTGTRKALLSDVPAWVKEVPGVEIAVINLPDAVPASIETFYGAQPNEPNGIIQPESRKHADMRGEQDVHQDSCVDIARSGRGYVRTGNVLGQSDLDSAKRAEGVAFHKVWHQSGCGGEEPRPAAGAVAKCDFIDVWAELLRAKPAARRLWDGARPGSWEDPEGWGDFSRWLESCTTIHWRSCAWHIGPFKALVQDLDLGAVIEAVTAAIEAVNAANEAVTRG